jgi:hypothetical protein
MRFFSLLVFIALGEIRLNYKFSNRHIELNIPLQKINCDVVSVSTMTYFMKTLFINIGDLVTWLIVLNIELRFFGIKN